MKEQKFVSVVAYVHDADSEIENFITKVMGTCTGLFDKCELIFVIDPSRDATVSRIHHYFDEHPADYIITLINMGVFQGIESSMNAGRDAAIGDYVFEFDDLITDYDESIIREAYEACLEGNDIVTVSSNDRMRLTSRLFYGIYNRNRSREVPIGQETFRLLSRRAINRIREIGSCIPYRKAVYSSSGLQIRNIRYDNNLGTNGLTRHSHKDERIDLALDAFIYFTKVMEKVSVTICAAFFLLLIGVLIYILYSLVADANLQSGWVSMMGFMSMGFFGIFLLLSIILRYLSVLVSLSYSRQQYLVRSIEKISRN